MEMMVFTVVIVIVINIIRLTSMYSEKQSGMRWITGNSQESLHRTQNKSHTRARAPTKHRKIQKKNPINPSISNYWITRTAATTTTTTTRVIPPNIRAWADR